MTWRGWFWWAFILLILASCAMTVRAANAFTCDDVAHARATMGIGQLMTLAAHATPAERQHAVDCITNPTPGVTNTRRPHGCARCK